MGERWLWHGTSETDVRKILASGFLRDLNTVSVYGKGTYFARDASYSLQKLYAKPDPATGDQFLLLSRVLVGEPCKGETSMKVPSYKAGTDTYHESMVDNVRNPTIFVLSTNSDHQAFPEFVLRVHTN